MSLPKFEFKLEEDQGFVFHNETPRCRALLGDDEDLFAEIKWQDPAKDEVKDAIKQAMTDWYWHELQGV